MWYRIQVIWKNFLNVPGYGERTYGKKEGGRECIK